MARSAAEHVRSRKALRIGVFGGSFNPVHLGHLIAARAAVRELRLDRLYLIPCARSADGKALWPAGLRMRLLRASLRGETRIRASDIELRRGGVSRTVETLRLLRAKLGPTAQLFLLIGQDQWSHFDAWREPKAIRSMATLVVIPRKSLNFSMWNKKSPLVLQTPLIKISASKVRERIAKKLSFELFLSKEAFRILKASAAK